MVPDRKALDGFAVDLGGTKIAAVRVAAGKIVSRAQTSTDAGATGEVQVAAMRDLLDVLDYRHGETLGIAVSGRIDAEDRWHAVNKGTLAQVSAVPLRDLVARMIGPCRCLNDGAASVLAEAGYGAGQGAANLAYLTVSTGVGGGLMMGGRLLTSTSGLAGHIGFSRSHLSDRMCGSGRSGTVESVAGGRAIAEAAARAGHPLDARGVAGAARKGAAWADAIINRSARAVAALIADLTAILGLDRAVLGGSIGLSDGYVDRVRDAMNDEPELFRVPLAPALLGTDAPLIGALAQACGKNVG